MAYIYMILCIGLMPLQNVCKKVYQRRSGGRGGAYLFTVLLAAAAALFFAVVGLADGGYHYEIGVLPYSLAFGVGYALCSFASTVAFTKGSMAITALIVCRAVQISAHRASPPCKNQSNNFQKKH